MSLWRLHFSVFSADLYVCVCGGGGGIVMFGPRMLRYMHMLNILAWCLCIGAVAGNVIVGPIMFSMWVGNASFGVFLIGFWWVAEFAYRCQLFDIDRDPRIVKIIMPLSVRRLMSAGARGCIGVTITMMLVLFLTVSGFCFYICWAGRLDLVS